MSLGNVLPKIDLAKCSSCGECILACSQEVLAMGEHGPIFIQADLCTYCADCETHCPENAIYCPLEIIWKP